jgi:hypothetical protein
MKPGEWAWEKGLSMARKLAVARHAHGFDAIGWVLLGFVMGAGVAVFALLHADILVRNHAPTIQASAGTDSLANAPLVPAVAPLPAVKPAPPIAAVAHAPPASAAPPAPALADAGAASAKGVAVDAAQALPSGPRPAPGPDQQVSADAAAAGMTSRSGATDSGGADLY